MQLRTPAIILGVDIDTLVQQCFDFLNVTVSVCLVGWFGWLVWLVGILSRQQRYRS
jgi:hypothetical protein